MDKRLTLSEAIKNCGYIPEESKTVFIQGLHSAIDLYKSELRNEKLLNGRYGISTEADREQANNHCAKLKDGIKAAKKLKKSLVNIYRDDSVLINELNEFIYDAEKNFKIEKLAPLAKGRQVNKKMHALGLSFKNMCEFYTKKTEVENSEVIRLAILFFYEAGIFSESDLELDDNEIYNKVEKLFKRQLNDKSKVTPYLQMVKSNN